MTRGDRLDRFLAFSSELTAFTTVELQGTGQAQSYLAVVDEVVGHTLTNQLLDAYHRIASRAPQRGSARDDLLRRDLFGDEKLGPIARNVIKLWYIGIWYELPRAWTEAFGAREKDTTFMASAAAYTEGLLWPAIGANPPGAKAPGYGS